MTMAFQLDGQEFTALNGGPQLKFNEAVSLVVHSETQRKSTTFGRDSQKGARKLNPNSH